MSNENEGWGEGQTEGAPAPAPTFSYPERVKDPHNHRFTISVDGRGPMIVVRAQTAQEVNEAFQELLEASTGALMGSFWSSFKAESQVANGLGGATPVPPAPSGPAQQAAQQFPTPPQPSAPQAPNQPYPGQPAWQQAGAPQPPMPPQGGGQGGGGNSRGPKPRPNWPQVYKINVPFNEKDNFKAFREQYKDAFKGKVSWSGGGDYWVEGSVVQSFANYNPVPA